jgi:signal peptidase
MAIATHTNEARGKRATAVGRGFRAVVSVMHVTAAAVLVLIVTGILALAIASNVSHDGTATFFGREALIVRSGSMTPAFSTGDAVLVRHVSGGELARLGVGDVVTYRASTTSRLLVVDAGGNRTFITKGDANPQPDADPVAESAVVGTVTRVVPRLGYLMYATQNRNTLLMFGLSLILVRMALAMVRHAEGQDNTQPTNEGTQ